MWLISLFFIQKLQKQYQNVVTYEALEIRRIILSYTGRQDKSAAIADTRFVLIKIDKMIKIAEILNNTATDKTGK